MQHETFTQLESAAQAGIEEVEARLTAAQATVETCEKERESLKELAEILCGLRTSWQKEDPGKYGAAYFFVAPGKEHKRVVARELLATGTVFFTEESWKEYLADNRSRGFLGRDFRFSPYAGVPPHFGVLPLAEVAQEECPHCGAKRPLIECYEQADDGPEGDLWRATWLLVCTGEMKIVTLISEAHEFRFR